MINNFVVPINYLTFQNLTSSCDALSYYDFFQELQVHTISFMKK